MRSFADRARLTLCATALMLLACVVPAHAQANAEKLYKDATTREAALRREIDSRKAGAPALPLLRSARILVGTYNDIARLFPKSPYSDNALWQGGMLAADAFWEFGEATDRASALRMLTALTSRFPTSSLVKQVQPVVARLGSAVPAAAAAAVQASTPASTPVALQSIRWEVLPETLRVTIELEREVAFYDERIDGPPRIFIDLQNTRSVEALKDATLAYADDVVRQIRVGRQLGMRTRVVLDLEGAGRYSVYPLYNPFRIVVDIERPGTTKSTKTLVATKDTKVTKPEEIAARTLPASTAAPGTIVAADISAVVPVAAVPPAPTPVVAPANAPSVVAATLPAAASAKAPTPPAGAKPVAPTRNGDGSLSLSRQLGLGVARVVIDPGHGGHDPGAQVKGLSEADTVLDIALRLEKLLLKQPGVEVVLTRRTNEYVPLEERTAIANRVDADLFLSIHANASEDNRARGVETYFLNFAANPQAEAIAARENAAAARTMRALPDIVKAIALNNKIDESHDFATLVQASMMERLRDAKRAPKNLGVKQAPFMVLIGATMPSVLAEISFVTNKQEQGWLKTAAYRQQLAEALFNGVMRYQRSLKGTQVASAP